VLNFIPPRGGHLVVTTRTAPWGIVSPDGRCARMVPAAARVVPAASGRAMAISPTIAINLP